MSEILQYRKQFYESSYDVRITCARGDSAEEIAGKVFQQPMDSAGGDAGYVSTRTEYPDGEEHPGFLDVVLEGLAPDGGLYVPRKKIPYLSLG